MKYKVHKQIEAKNPKRKAALNNRIKKELNISDDDDNSGKTEISVKKPFYKTYRFFAGISTAFVAVCLVIVLPIVLNNNKLPSERYCNANDCYEIRIDYTLNEYGERNNVPYLYVDWYEIADDVQTKLYVNKENQDELIYVRETLVNGETGSVAVLSITDLYTKVDILDSFWDECDNTNNINGINIHWHSRNLKSKAYFEYGNYRYFVELSYPLEEDSILELIEGMIP